jgi:hypothetical protein
MLLIFSGPMSDATPSEDQISNLRLGLHYMLIQEIPIQQFDINSFASTNMNTNMNTDTDTDFPSVGRSVQYISAQHISNKVSEYLLNNVLSSSVILLFPSFPFSWSASFQLYASNNTMIQVQCINGTVTQLIVSPVERKNDVILIGCQLPM